MSLDVPELYLQPTARFDIDTLATSFRLRYPIGRIATIAELEEMPPVVTEHLVASSRTNLHPDDIKPVFDGMFRIDYPNRSTTYGAYLVKASIRDAHVEENIYVIDTVDGLSAGHGEIRKILFSDDKQVIKMPFVGFTSTSEDFAKMGLGRRRLETMNALTQGLFDQPLHSGARSTTFAERIWQGLSTEDKVRRVRTGDHMRWKFIV